MAGFRVLGPAVPPGAQDLLDPLLLVLFTLPLVYFMVVRPLLQGIEVRDRAIAQLTLASTVFENAGEGIIIVDPAGVISSVNPGFTRITGYSAEDVLGQTPRLLKSGRHDARFYVRMWASIRTEGQWQGEIWNRRKNGEIYPEHLSVTAVRGTGGALVCYVGIFSRANHDHLTGLANRHLVTDEIGRAIARARREKGRVAALFIDLDGFKAVNDQLGHDRGDEVLSEVADLLRSAIRESDLAARWGGDEFLVLLPDVLSADAAEGVANKVKSSFELRCLLDRPDIVVTPSIGVAVYPDHAEDAAGLLRAADTAMYAAKSAGKNTVRCAT